MTRRAHARPAAEPLTLANEWRAAILEMLEAEHRIRFPSPRYAADFDAFVREILGVEPDDLDEVDAAAARALWLVCTFDDAHEHLEAMRALSGRCVACVHADPSATRITRPCPHSAVIERALVANLAGRR